MTEPSRACTRCGVVQTLDGYHKSKGYADGHKRICKTCCSKANVRYKESAEADGRTKGWRDTYREKNSENIFLQKVKWEISNPEKRSAHHKVQNAVRTGVLVRPNACQRCERNGIRIEASHHDYSRPLDVEWLCVPCHRKKDANPFTNYKEYKTCD